MLPASCACTPVAMAGSDAFTALGPNPGKFSTGDGGAASEESTVGYEWRKNQEWIITSHYEDKKIMMENTGGRRLDDRKVL